jgi:exopolysaccharide biosynthesis polyprenyl glycosylphosphotransferase
MTAEQATETLVLPLIPEPVAAAQESGSAADRQDVLRRAAVIAGDAGAAVLLAICLGWALDSLTLCAALTVPAGWTLGAWAVGAYHRRRLKARLLDVKALLQTTVLLWAAAGVCAAVTPIADAPTLILVAVPATLVAVCAARLALLPLTRAGGGLTAAPVVLYGPQDDVRKFCAATAAGANAPAVIAAACVTDLGRHSEPWISPDPNIVDVPAEDPVESVLDRVLDTVRRTGADTVVVTGPARPEVLRALSWRLEEHAVGVAVTPLWAVTPERVTVRTCGDATLVEVAPPRYDGARQLLRELADRTLAACALVLLAPVLAGVALMIKATSPGPVLFTQLRTGQGGRRFRLLKFRTMVADAERLKDALAAENQYTDGTLFKVRDDPRITPIGSVLRALSLDELPQLVNVVRGEMALVGPRPTATPPEQMPPDYRRRMLVKPGLTGLWQVSGRSNLPWEEAVRLDLRYVENRSLAMDLDILCRTLPAVLSRDGAY